MQALGDQDRARKYYKQLESDANNQLIAQFAGASQSGAQGQQQPSLAVLVPDGGAVVPLKEFAAFAAREAGEADKGR